MPPRRPRNGGNPASGEGEWTWTGTARGGPSSSCRARSWWRWSGAACGAHAATTRRTGPRPGRDPWAAGPRLPLRGTPEGGGNIARGPYPRRGPGRCTGLPRRRRAGQVRGGPMTRCSQGGTTEGSPRRRVAVAVRCVTGVVLALGFAVLLVRSRASVADRFGLANRVDQGLPLADGEPGAKERAADCLGWSEGDVSLSCWRRSADPSRRRSAPDACGRQDTCCGPREASMAGSGSCRP